MQQTTVRLLQWFCRHAGCSRHVIDILCPVGLVCRPKYILSGSFGNLIDVHMAGQPISGTSLTGAIEITILAIPLEGYNTAVVIIFNLDLGSYASWKSVKKTQLGGPGGDLGSGGSDRWIWWSWTVDLVDRSARGAAEPV